MTVRAHVPLGILTLAVCGCATPQLGPWDPPAPWKVDQARSPAPAPLSRPTPPATTTEFAVEAVRLAGETEPAAAAPDIQCPAPSSRLPDGPAPDPGAVGLN